MGVPRRKSLLTEKQRRHVRPSVCFEPLLRLAGALDLRPIRIARCLQDVLNRHGAVEPSLDLRPFLAEHMLKRAEAALALACVLAGYCCTNCVTVKMLLSPRLRAS